MKNIILCAKGFLMGLANLIPGISGGTLAITLGIYEDFISALSSFFTKIKENLLFLTPILMGILLSLLALSKVIDYCLANFVFATILFFVGAILGGLPLLTGRMKGEKITISHFIIFAVSFGVVVGSVFLTSGAEVSFENADLLQYIKIFGTGMIASVTMLVPGISGSAVLMTIGYYGPIISALNNLTNPDLMISSILVLLPYGIGIIAGLLLAAKSIEYLINTYPIKSYWAIVAFVLGSIIGIIKQNFFINGMFITISVAEIIIGIILAIIAFFMAYKLGGE